MSNEELDNLDPSFYAIWNLRDALEKMIEKHPCQNTVDPSRCHCESCIGDYTLAITCGYVSGDRERLYNEWTEKLNSEQSGS